MITNKNRILPGAARASGGSFTVHPVAGGGAACAGIAYRIGTGAAACVCMAYATGTGAAACLCIA